MTEFIGHNETQKTNILIGMEKDKTVYAAELKFKPGINVDLDLIMASVIMRPRQVVKNLFNSNSLKNVQRAAKLMEIEDLFELDFSGRMSAETKNLKNLKDDLLVFYFSEDMKWMMVGNCDVLKVDHPTPAEQVYKGYYESYYPPEVVEFAFKDPNEIKRVYQVDEKDGFEDFLFEPLFKESDVVEHIYVPLPNDPKVA